MLIRVGCIQAKVASKTSLHLIDFQTLISRTLLTRTNRIRCTIWAEEAHLMWGHLVNLMVLQLFSKQVSEIWEDSNHCRLEEVQITNLVELLTLLEDGHAQFRHIQSKDRTCWWLARAWSHPRSLTSLNLRWTWQKTTNPAKTSYLRILEYLKKRGYTRRR